MVFRGTCNSGGGIQVKSKKQMGGRGQNHGSGASALLFEILILETQGLPSET